MSKLVNHNWIKVLLISGHGDSFQDDKRIAHGVRRKARPVRLGRRAVPFLSDYREGAVISGVTGGGLPGSRARGTGEQRRG